MLILEGMELVDKISKQENRSKSNMIEKLIKDYNR